MPSLALSSAALPASKLIAALTVGTAFRRAKTTLIPFDRVARSIGGNCERLDRAAPAVRRILRRRRLLRCRIGCRQPAAWAATGAFMPGAGAPPSLGLRKYRGCETTLPASAMSSAERGPGSIVRRKRRAGPSSGAPQQRRLPASQQRSPRRSFLYLAGSFE